MTSSSVLGQTTKLEIAHVLFMDIVGYSKLPLDHQRKVLGTLQEVVSATPEFLQAQASHQMIRLPTGDGMAVVFFEDAEGAARCAMDVSRGLKSHPEIPLRMGLHSGPVYRIADINANQNVAGGGINIAQRVMDCGDAGHILASQSVADVLGHLSRWKECLHDLGEADVKHGVRIHLYNVYTNEVGNAKVPRKLLTRRRKRLRLGMVAGAIAALAIVAGVVLAWRLGGPRRPVTSAGEYIQLTNFNDSATAPALSPDGRMVTFFRGGGYFLSSGQIYVKMLPDGESKQLTFDSNAKYDPVFTPDGSRVAFTGLSFANPSFDTWTVPVLGGPPARLMVNAAGLSWIGPDRILFSEITAGTALHMGIVTANESRAEERAIYFPTHERAMAHYSWLSPDRDWVLIAEMNGSTEWQRCRVVPMDGRSSGVQVGPQSACTAAAWSPDGRWIYVNVEVDGSTHLWRQRWDDGATQKDPEQITFGPTEEEGLAVALDGKSLIASVGVRQSSVWTHDAAGNHAVSLEGSAEAPRLSADGKRLYYLLRKKNSSNVGELWRRDLASGKSDPVLTDQRIVDYDISRDEARVAFTALIGDESQIFLAATDRSTPPRLVVRGGDMVSFGGGELIFRQVGGKANYVALVHEDGTGLTRILETKIAEIGSVSPNGEWVTVGGLLESGPGTFAIAVRNHAQRRICAGACFVQWSADGRYMYVSPISRFSAVTSTGHTYVIEIPHGFGLLDLPKSGIDHASEAELAGIQSIPQADMSPGPDPQTYAFTSATFRGNLFRIPLH